jgi:hypothetical protein
MDISTSVLGSKPSFIKKPQNQTGPINSVFLLTMAAMQNNKPQGSAPLTQLSGQNLNSQHKNPFQQVPICYNCRKPGHIAIYCRSPQKQQDSNNPFTHIQALAIPLAF